MTWLGQRDAWPSHDKPPLQAALQDARRHGWYLKLHTNNSFGRVVCRLTEDGDCCKETIYSTPADPESFSIEFRKKMKACPHRDRDIEGIALEGARELIGQATSLLNAAEKCLDGISKKAHAADLLEQAILKLNGVEEELLAEADILESEGQVLIIEAVTASSDLGVFLGDPPDPLLAVQEARVRVSRARSETSQAARRDVNEVKAQVRRVRDRANALQVRIDAQN